MNETDRTETAAPKALLDYVPELLDEMERIKASQDAARSELRRIDLEIERTGVALAARRRELTKADRSRALAEAALRGEALPPEPPDPPGIDPKVLEDALRGLRAMRETPAKEIEDTKVALRVACHRSVIEAVERAAADLVPAVRRVEELRALVGAAQRLVECTPTPPGRAPQIILGQDWFGLFCIPSVEGIEALGPATRKVQFRARLAGDDLEGEHKAATRAFEEAQREVRRRLGGTWPLDRGY